MNQISRKSMIGTFALVASLTAPLALAQTADPASDPATESAQSSMSAAATTDTPASTAQQATVSSDTAATAQATSPTVAADASSDQQGWNDVDADKNGKISKAEAAAVPALGQVFDAADSNADGALTPKEYKDYVAQVQSAAAPATPGS